MGRWWNLGGKTTTCKKYLYAQYKEQIENIKNKTWTREDINERKIQIENKFIWLNRTDSEIKQKQNNLFKEFGWVCYGKANEIQIIIDIDVYGDKGVETRQYALTLGKYEAINNSSKIRGGDSFAGYSIIVWDEFMDEKGAYLPNEFNSVQSIIMTTMRSKKGTKWFFLSNSVDSDNPVFKALNFNPRKLEKNQQMYFPKKRVVCYYVGRNENFKKEYDDSDYMSVLGETQYTSYRLGGDFAFEDNSYILKEPDPAYSLKFKFNIKIAHNYFGVYEYKNGLWIADKLIADNTNGISGVVYPLTKEDAIEDGIPWTSQSTRLSRWFYANLNNQNIWFEDKIIRMLILNFVKINYPNLR